MEPKNEQTKCGHCGRFMSYTEPALTVFTPDTAFTTEEVYVVHPQCA